MEKYIRVENDTIPLLGYGTYKMSGKECVESVADALNMGYRHIDTAQLYYNEDEVGQGVKNSKVDREDIFITTKVSTHNMEPDSLRYSTERSLKSLDSEYIDLLLVHWPVKDMNLDAILGTMLELKKEDKVRHLGVSNFSPSLFKKAIEKAPVICNQVEFTPYSPQNKNLEIAKNEDLMITAYSPLVKGKISDDAVLNEIGGKYGKTAAQVSLRWLLQLGNVSVIPKASSEQHRRENMEIFDFELDEEDMRKISELQSEDI